MPNSRGLDESVKVPNNPIRFGVLGAARITPQALMLPSAKLPSVEITRIAARDRSRAEAFAKQHGIANVADDYRSVVEADDVDVVYNPLPMSLHAEWTIAALRAGKHVLCEKPLASNATEAAEMVRVAQDENRILGEAFHHYYHPLFRRVLDEVQGCRIGELERVEAAFEIKIAQPDIRWDYSTAGGSLMDLGCYPVAWVRHVVGDEPSVISAEAVEGPPKVDASIAAELSFPSGVTGRIQSSMVSDSDRISLRIIGAEGEIIVENPLAPHKGNSLTIRTSGGTTSGPIDAGITYEHMVRAFVDHLRHGSPFPTSGADSVANMALIDAIYTAAGLPVRGEN